MDEQINTLIEKDKIIDRLNNLFIKTDNRDWPGVKNCFNEKVHFDMTSMGAEKAEILKPEQITQGWEEGLKSLEAIHHQIGNYLVEFDDDGATAFCYGIASHYKKTASGNNSRTFVGNYNFHLVKREMDWKIDSFKFNLKYIDGNINLED